MPHNGKNYSARQGGPAKEMATASARQTPGAARSAALVGRRPMQRWPAGQKFFRRKESGEASEKPCANARHRAAAGNMSEKRKGGQEYMQRSGGGTDGRQRERLQRRDSRFGGGEQADGNAHAYSAEIPGLMEENRRRTTRHGAGVFSHCGTQAKCILL